MNKREQHAVKLLAAASTLDPVDLSRDAHPQLNLTQAYDAGLSVWREMSSYGTSHERAGLRVSLLGIRAINEAINEGRRVHASDNEKLREAATTMRSVAMRVWPQAVLGKDDRSETKQVSPLGLRMRSLKELAGTQAFVVLPSVREPAPIAPPVLRAQQTASEDVVHSDMQSIEALQRFRSKLPRSVKPGDPFVAVRMPVLVYTKRSLDARALKRAGIKFFELRNFGPPKDTATVDKKLSRENGSGYVFENQLVIGMRPDEVLDSKKRPKSATRVVVIPDAGEDPVPLKNLDSKLRRVGFKRDVGSAGDLSTTARGATVVRYKGGVDVQYVIKFKNGTAVTGKKQKVPVVMSEEVTQVPGAARRAVDSITKQLGPHTNPLSSDSPGEGLIRSPGSHLSFMWLLPDHELSVIGKLVISGAAFPWRQLESAEQRTERLAALTKELKVLEEQQTILLKHKKVLEPSKLQRISELRELLDRSKGDKAPLTLEERKEKLTRLKAELDAEVKQKNADLFAKIAELKEDLDDEEDPQERKALQKSINELNKRIERSREVLAVKYRSRM